MNEFSFSTKLFFGEGSLGRLRSIKGKRVLVITDSFIYNCGTAQKVEKYLANCKVTYFKDVVPDPPVEVISAGIKSLIKAEAEVLIAIGGGSALDSAKAIKSMAEQIYPEKIRICEFVAIPTTSGTGSEVTDLAIITDKESNIKFPLQGAELRPCTAILDPTLVLSAPPSVTADTGMDVLTHAIEAYVSNGATDFSDALAEKAAALVMEFLPLVYKNGGNILAREKMHNASCMAGLAFNSAGLGLTHGISHALGAHLHIPHGRANALLLPHIIEYNANLNDCRNGIFSEASKKYQRLARILGLPADTPLIGSEQLKETVIKLNRTLGIPSDLKFTGGLNEALKNAAAEAALKDITASSNPRVPTKQDIIDILNACDR